MPETPWPNDKQFDAKIIWENHIDEDLGFLHFQAPDGSKAVIWVTEGPTCQRHGQNVWHVDVSGDQVTVSPSIHFIDHFHSPNPVTFRLVDELSV